MRRRKAGRWDATIHLADGESVHYKFLVDGELWLDDPENSDKARDGYGGFNAVLKGSPAES